jgi:hypothetical protein
MQAPGVGLARNGRASRTSDAIDARLAWLQERPDLWRGLPSDSEDVEPEASERISELVLQLRVVGLFGKGAIPEQKMSVRRAIGVLKREARA